MFVKGLWSDYKTKNIQNKVITLNNTGQNMSLFFHLVRNGDTNQTQMVPVFIFSGDCTPGIEQNRTLNADLWFEPI